MWYAQPTYYRNIIQSSISAVNLAMALDELSNILDKVPKQTHVAGDFNIDLHGSNSKNIQDYENAIFSKGFFPTISTVTHEKPGVQAFVHRQFYYK